jgi:transposase
MRKKTDKKFQIQSKVNRTFSTEFKREKVKDLIAKRIKINDLCELYGVTRTSVYKWLYLYSGTQKGTKTVVQMDSEQQKTKVLLERLAEYERIIGQKQMQIDLLEKGFELAGRELGYDLKKKYAPRVWSGSDNTGQNTDTK